MPGSPASRTTDPFVRPPPNTRSHSPMPVWKRTSPSDWISSRLTGWVESVFASFEASFLAPPGRHLLGEAVPNPAFGTFAHPFRAYVAALLASVDQFRFGHFPPSTRLCTLKTSTYPYPSACLLKICQPPGLLPRASSFRYRQALFPCSPFYAGSSSPCAASKRSRVQEWRR